MTALLWIGGTLALVVVAMAPLVTARVRRRRVAAVSRDRALALLSRLEHALERADVTEGRRREAERCRLLAGAALAGRTEPADAARAQKWAQAGLTALGERET